MEAGIDLKSIIGLLHRQIWLIVITILTCIVATLAVTYSITPKYSASAVVLVDTSNKNLLSNDNRATSSANDNARVESEVGILRSDRVLVDVVRENNLVADDEFGIKVSRKDRLLSMLRVPLPPAPTEEQALGRVLNGFRSAVSINRDGLTYLITIGVVSKEPEKAAKLANSLTTAYIEQQINSKISSTLAARDTIEKRLPVANAAIIQNENQFNDYIRDTIDRLEQESPGSNTLTSLKLQLEQLETQRTTELDRIEAVQKSISERDYGRVVATLGSQALQELQRQRESLTSRIVSSTNSEQQVNLRAELAKLDTALQSGAEQQVAEIRQNVSLSQERESAVRNEIQQAFLNSNLPTEVLTRLSSLRQSAELARTQYQTLLSRLQDLNAQSELQLPDSRVVSAALTPTSPSFPNRNLILALAFVVSLGLGIALAITREYFIGGFTSQDQVQSVLRVPLASIAPRQTSVELAKAGGNATSIPDLMVTSPLSLFSESLRRLRLAIDQQVRRNRPVGDAETGDKSKIILLSSSLPNEGKSTLALSLARGYAMMGQRTLLIDCDLRKPSLNKYLNLEPSHDFIDYLRKGAGSNGLPSMTMKDPMSNLTVLLGGRRSDVATDELVMSDRMTRILAGARKHFDYIILDTPPIEPIVDALYLARHADMIVFVLKWASTPQSSAKRSIAALQENKKPEAGIVTILNQQEKTKLTGYSSYASYYTE